MSLISVPNAYRDVAYFLAVLQGVVLLDTPGVRPTQLVSYAPPILTALDAM